MNRVRSVGSPGLPRLFALAGALVVLVAFLSVMADAIGTVGDPWPLSVVVLCSLAAGTVLSDRSRLTLLSASVGGLTLCLGLYLWALSGIPSLTTGFEHNLALLSGESVRRIERVWLWGMVVTPIPVALCWALALGRAYAASAAVGGGALGYLVLTGDAGQIPTLCGVLGVIGLLGFGELDRGEFSRPATERLLLVLAVVAVAPFLVTIVPGGTGEPLPVAAGGDGQPLSLASGGEDRTMEEAVLTSETSLDITGNVDQNPEVRFTVSSVEPAYWRTGSFDRYTGDGWVQTDEPTAYEGNIEPPPGPSTTLPQTVEAVQPLERLPAAWQPTRLDSDTASRASVVGDAGLTVEEPLAPGERYRVSSRQPNPTTGQLHDAPESYPAEISERYTQLPADLPDRVTAFSDDLVEGAESDYEAAVIVERWLESNREYSLDVETPTGDVTDAFLFEMEAGYCTYYATAMATMLRTQDIPTRVAVGYTAGEQTGSNEWAVRGLHSHAWVEVYVPDVGWIEFDPTPAASRSETEQTAVQSAREDGVDGVDIPETEQDSDRETEQPTADEQHQEVSPDDGVETGANDQQPAPTEYDDGSVPSWLSWQLLLVSGVVFAGAAVVVGRTLPSGFRIPGGRAEPDERIERTYRRLLADLERQYRPRRSGEPVRAYLDAVGADDQAHRIVAIRQRARYGNEATPELARTASTALTQRRREQPASTRLGRLRFKVSRLSGRGP